MFRDICDSVLTKAEEVCDYRCVAVRAQEICDEFKELNRLFSEVHCRISHQNPTREEETAKMPGMINIYMSYYRREFPEVRVIPKQHLLESHCVPWIQRWGFGLSLHGEQGGEEAQATVNCLKKKKKKNVLPKNKEEQLRVLKTEHMAMVSPLFHRLMPSSQRRKQ